MSETIAIIRELRESGLSDGEIYQFSIGKSTEFFGITEHSDGYKKWVAVMHHFEAEMHNARQKKDENRQKRAEYAREYRRTKKAAEEACKGRGFGWYWKYIPKSERLEGFRKLPKIQQWRQIIEFARLE